MSDDDLKKFGQMIDDKLKPIADRLDDPNQGLGAINEKLGTLDTQVNNPETGVSSINQKLEDVIAELHEVHKLAGMTYDVVKLQKEKYDSELDEIRSHTGLPSAHREPL